MVPFRPTPKTPVGAIQWREVKVGILARLGTRVTRAGKRVPQLLRRRLVAVLGTIDDFIPPLQLEATRQGVDTAPLVVWLSDGGRGFWRVYHTCCATAIAVLDFFHAASHLARATQALFDTLNSAEAQAWFRRWRHLLRHGPAPPGPAQLPTCCFFPGWGPPPPAPPPRGRPPPPPPPPPPPTPGVCGVLGAPPPRGRWGGAPLPPPLLPRRRAVLALRGRGAPPPPPPPRPVGGAAGAPFFPQFPGR